MQGTRTPHDELGVFALMANALALKPFRIDSFERRDLAPGTVDANARPLRRSLLERLDRWLWKREQREVEAHLSNATDVYDLEARIRDLERGVMYRYY
ncbi:MAG: DUF3563 family protein [Betaproteobacteria bacterium]